MRPGASGAAGYAMMADAFYQARVSEHLAIGLRAIELLRAEADAETLHSRKLRSFDEPFLR